MRDRGKILAHFGNYGHRHEKLHQKSIGKHIHTQSAGRSRRGTGRWFRLRERDAGSRVQREVNAWRVTLDERGLGSSSIIVRMSAIRKLAAEAADNGLLAPELAAGIQRVKSAKSIAFIE